MQSNIENSGAISVQNPDNLLAMAVDKGADIDQLTKLMNLKERYEASEAKKAFYSSLSEFQSVVPTIKKSSQVSYGNTSYMFAPLGAIAEHIRESMKSCGLSYRFEQNHENGIEVSCIVTHVLGHSEKTTMKAGSDNSGGKNAIQAIGSTVTYLQRYTLINALGLTTADEDIDAGRPDVTVDEILNYNAVLRDEFASIAEVKLRLAENNYSSAREAWSELEESVQISLWKAPSKGGIFTTEERTKMKSKEWSES